MPIVSIRVSFVGNGSLTYIQSALAEAPPNSQAATWVQGKFLQNLQEPLLLPAPPHVATWRSTFQNIRDHTFHYLAPGYGRDDDPGIPVLLELCTDSDITLDIGAESSSQISGPTLVGAATEKWLPNPNLTTIVRGIATSSTLTEWQRSIATEYGESVVAQVRPWNSDTWIAYGEACALDFPLSLRAQPSPQSALRSIERLREVIRRLRAPDGCPWDIAQTHESLRPHLVEESHEAIAAVESGDDSKIAEEFGDVLLQVVLHAEIGRQRDGFTWADVIEAITSKMIRRHPHVFGEAHVESVADVMNQWDRIKASETILPNDPIEGVPNALPSLAFACAAVHALRKSGTEITHRQSEQEMLQALKCPTDPSAIGDALVWIVSNADAQGIDVDLALRDANLRLRHHHTHGNVSA